MKNTPKVANILIIDDEESIRFSLCGILEDEGYSTLGAESGEAGLELLAKNDVDLIFLDIWLPGMDGHQVLDQLRSLYPYIPVLMISGHATIDHAVSAIKSGAHDFIEKPLSLEKVLISVARALEFKALRRENQALRSSQQKDNELLGESGVIVNLRHNMDKVAPLDTGVLITGENGTGKEIAAQYIHSHSRRAAKPLIAVNCAAIPEELIESELFGHERGAFTGADGSRSGKFELAHQGTLFLDEIGDMSLKTQAKILRILQEQQFERVGGTKTIHVDVRVIAATNKNLEEAIRRGEFREDLYYRLRVFPLHMPPLRERGSDTLAMLDYFTQRFQKDYGLKPMQFDASAKETLLHYRWPGNVRELRNFVERMLIMHSGQAVSQAMLPAEILGYTPYVACSTVPLGAGAAQNTAAISGGNPNVTGSAGTAAASGSAAAQNTAAASGSATAQNAAAASGSATAQNAAAASGSAAAQNAAAASGSVATPEVGATPENMLDNDFKAARAKFEESYLEAKLKEFDGNISKLAVAIGMERSYLSRKLKSLGIAD